MFNANVLIKEILEWRKEKDDAEYKAKVEEENRTYKALEQINGEILEDIKGILRVKSVLSSCNISTEKIMANRPFMFVYPKDDVVFNVRFLTSGTTGKVGRVSKTSNEMAFYEKDIFHSTATTTPPSSKELNEFINAFHNFRDEFRQFVEDIIKS